MRKSKKKMVGEVETGRKKEMGKRGEVERCREGERRDHVEGGGVQRLRKTHKQAYCNNGRACCTNTISG